MAISWVLDRFLQGIALVQLEAEHLVLKVLVLERLHAREHYGGLVGQPVCHATKGELVTTDVDVLVVPVEVVRIGRALARVVVLPGIHDIADLHRRVAVRVNRSSAQDCSQFDVELARPILNARKATILLGHHIIEVALPRATCGIVISTVLPTLIIEVILIDVEVTKAHL